MGFMCSSAAQTSFKGLIFFYTFLIAPSRELK